MCTKQMFRDSCLELEHKAFVGVDEAFVPVHEAFVPVQEAVGPGRRFLAVDDVGWWLG